MKTKTFLLLCLFLGIGLTQLSAQNGQKEATKTYSEWISTTWSDPVFCDGVLIDWLDCTMTFHHVAKFVKGEWLHCYGVATGTAVSGKNGELFTIKDFGKQDNNIMPDGSWEYVSNIHFNAIGSSGTRYIVFATLYWDGRVESARSVCLGN
jgi:hypothetical protein